ncbi:MAG: hypothetical protein ACO3PV_02870 [Pseudohongiellaceae bacterium]
MNSFATWLESTFMNKLMVDIFWMFPLMETIHFVGLILLFGALLVVDGRVLGWGRFINMKAAMSFIPVAIVAFSLNLITGIFFVASQPAVYFGNMVFQWKMALIVIAGINALWFWFGEHKELLRLADGQEAPFRAKVIALASLVIWVLVIIGGRMIPYGPGGTG